MEHGITARVESPSGVGSGAGSCSSLYGRVLGAFVLSVAMRREKDTQQGEPGGLWLKD